MRVFAGCLCLKSSWFTGLVASLPLLTLKVRFGRSVVPIAGDGIGKFLKKGFLGLVCIGIDYDVKASGP